MGAFNPLYGKWDKQHKLVSADPVGNFGISMEAYKAQIGIERHTPAIKAASEWGGTRVPLFVIPLEDFKKIAADASILIKPANEAQVKKYLYWLYEAFRIFAIDTVEAQALFLAHGAGETGFARFTEGQDKNFVDDPSLVEIDMETKKSLADRTGPTRYAQPYYVEHGDKDLIDPSGAIWLGGEVPTAPGQPARTKPPMVSKDFDDTFIGRAPLQVTFGWAYVQTLVYVDAVRDNASAIDAKVLTNLYDAVRMSPTEAARAEHTFLFAAAFMHMSSMVKNAPGGFTEAGMSGGHPDAQGGPKGRAYAAAIKFLKESADAYKRAGAAPDDDTD